jgi:hypothetical protein
MFIFTLALIISFSKFSQATEIKTTGATSRPTIISSGLIATQDKNCNILLINTKTQQVVDSLTLPKCTRGEFPTELLFKGNTLFSLTFLAGKEFISYSLARISVKDNRLTFNREFNIQLPNPRGVFLRPTSVLETGYREVGFLVASRDINSAPVETTFISIDSKLLSLKLNTKIPGAIIEVSAFDKASGKSYFSSQSGEIFSYEKASLSKLIQLPTDTFKRDLVQAGYIPQNHKFRVHGINILSGSNIVINANAGIYVVRTSDLSLQSFSALELGQLSRANSLLGIQGGWGSKAITSPSSKSVLIPIDSGYFSIAVLNNKVLIENLSVKSGHSLNKPNGIPTFVSEDLLYYQIRNEIAFFKKVDGKWVSIDSAETNISKPGSSSWIIYSSSHIWAGYIHPSLITAHEI